MKVDGYIRVSKVAGRAGESFISPGEQRKAIEAYAAAHGLDLAAWHEDLDQSGGTLDRPGFQAALDRCRNGETGGIIAAKLDRLTRSTVGLGTLIDEAREDGWNLIAVDFGLDLFAANGKLVADVLAAVAEWERTRRGDDWEAARRNAIERGVPNGRPPIGYRKRPDGRFEADESADNVREAFRLRADGVAFANIGRRFGWSHSTVRQMLGNDTYLGVARAGRYVNEHAHPALVDRALFDAVQAARTSQPVPAGQTTKDRLLVGIARCAGCGKTLKVLRRRRADESHVVSYYCKDAASVPCRDRAYVHADELDGFVQEWFEGTLRTVPRMVDVVARGRELERAQAEQATAEAELHGYVENASTLDPALFTRGLNVRQERAEKARERVRQLSGRLARIPAGGTLHKLWDTFGPLERRDVLAAFVDRVDVRRGASGDLAGHVRILWADGTVAQDEESVRVAAA